jgi:hypothetical protein
MAFDIQELYAELRELSEAGREAEARALLAGRLSELPEELRAEIMLDMFADALEGEARGMAALREIQKEGLAAAALLAPQEGGPKKEGD